MQFDRSLVLTKRSTRINRQTQIDRSGVERIDGRVQTHVKRLVGIQGLGHVYQMLSKVGINKYGNPPALPKGLTRFDRVVRSV